MSSHETLKLNVNDDIVSHFKKKRKLFKFRNN